MTIGLSSSDVAARVAAGQVNRFHPRTSRSMSAIIRANVFTLFNGIMAACFVILLVLGFWQDALFGFSALANTVIGSAQELRAKAALDRLALLSAPLARVMRDGLETEVAVGEVVMDDLLRLRTGDQLPADAVVEASEGLQVDEAMLTGESDPVDKDVGDSLLSGSAIVGGSGIARVDRVGADTFANHLSAEARRFSLVASELRSGIGRVLRWVSWMIGPAAALVFNAQVIALGGWSVVFHGDAWREAALNTVGAVVAMIPLGLVLMTSIAFAVGAARLAGDRVLVQELAAVEALARVDLICFDKTGTLTQGLMEFDDEFPSASGCDEPAGWRGVLGWFSADRNANATARCLAQPYPAPVSAEPLGRIPFSSARKWSAVSFATEAPGSWVMGGPDMVFPDGRLEPRAAQLAAAGLRTLVLARTDEPLPEDERLPEGLTPVTLLTFRERVRADAADTVKFFADEGVDVRVISGDDPRTVAAIARTLGIPRATGFDARDLPDDAAGMADVLARHTVLGRVTPDQKRAIVIALQSAGHTVAMTGDGVNDIPALKQADVGIALQSGSAATKAVAPIVLLDSDFARLPTIVAEGRRVIANIERISMLYLTKTVYATALAVLIGAFLLQFPFLPRQLSVIDGLTIGLPAFFLALVPNPRRYVSGFLGRALSFALPTGLVIGSALFAYSWWATQAGVGQAELRTGSTVLLTLVGMWVLIVLCRPLDPRKLMVIGSVALASLLVYTIPFSRAFLVLVDLSAATWLSVVACTIVSIGLAEALRVAVRRRYPGRMLRSMRERDDQRVAERTVGAVGADRAEQQVAESAAATAPDDQEGRIP